MMLTEGHRSEYKERCHAVGADYFFEKWNDLQKMTALLGKLART
jgi:hypothetical protein